MTTVLKVVNCQQGLGVSDVEGAVDLCAHSSYIIEVGFRTHDRGGVRALGEEGFKLARCREDVGVVEDVGWVPVAKGIKLQGLAEIAIGIISIGVRPEVVIISRGILDPGRSFDAQGSRIWWWPTFRGHDHDVRGVLYLGEMLLGGRKMLECVKEQKVWVLYIGGIQRYRPTRVTYAGRRDSVTEPLLSASNAPASLG